MDVDFIEVGDRKTLERKEIKTICGMKIVENFRYLGIDMACNKADIVKNVKGQIAKYVKCVKGKSVSHWSGRN